MMRQGKTKKLHEDNKKGEMQVSSWEETQLQALLGAENAVDLFVAISRAAVELEFEYCAYGMRVPLPVSQPKILMVNNYPKEWQLHYTRENYLTIDPTVSHGARSIAPLVWTDEIFSSCPSFWEEARAHGLRVGWAQSCYDSQGVGGLLTLARPNDKLTVRELDERSLRRTWLTQLAHQGMSRFLVQQLMPETLIQLTSREIEVLRWTADAKTASEVAEILNIAERTVNFHINNAMEKLGVCNKIAAAIKAAMLRIL